MNKPIIIAIDGYSSCGKSTLAKALAKKLNYAYIDTGAMYRAVTLYLLRNNIDWENATNAQLENHLDSINITFKFNEALGFSETYLNGDNIEQEIRGKVVSDAVSEVAQLKVIRQRMVGLQQKSGKEKKLVMDGRDIGTKVFPDAELKIFMTAKPEIRAQRRFKELKGKGEPITIEEIRKNLEKRDHYDTHREENPLTQAEGAIILDNSNIDQEAQLKMVLEWVEKI